MKRRTRKFWQIEMTAENLLRHCECFDSPCDGIDFMIESCNIDCIPLYIRSDKLMGVFGDDGKGHKFIGYNMNMNSERILFTKAHELGHFVLEHKLQNELLTDTLVKSQDPQETEANVFAAALLMPRVLVINVIRKAIANQGESVTYDNIYDNKETIQKYMVNIISAMVNTFHTSKEASCWRVKDIISK